MPKVDFLFCNALTILFCSSFLVIRKKFYNACDLGGGHGDKEGILEGFARNFKLLFCGFLSSRIRFFFVCELSVNFAPIKNYPDFSFCMFVFKCRWLSFLFWIWKHGFLLFVFKCTFLVFLDEFCLWNLGFSFLRGGLPIFQIFF